jgi:hypothetical protein
LNAGQKKKVQSVFLSVADSNFTKPTKLTNLRTVHKSAEGPSISNIPHTPSLTREVDKSQWQAISAIQRKTLILRMTTS